MKKYLSLLKIALQNSLINRGRGLVWLAWDILPPLIMLLFWQAAFINKQEIAGYSLASMFIYYLLVMFIRAVIYTHPDEDLNMSITTGRLTYIYLIKPLNIVLYYLFHELGYKVNRLIFIMPIIILFLLLGSKLIQVIPFNMLAFVNFLVFISFTFILFFLIKLLIGISSFWFNEIGWLQDLSDFLLPLLGGILFPLDFLPPKIYNLSLWLPFRFEVFVPIQIFLGKVQGKDFYLAFIQQLVWICFFLILIKILWRRGTKIYSAYGN